jgi:hypothetical protein
MKVYRVETDDGLGPYVDLYLADILPYYSTYDQPGPADDGIMGHLWDSEHHFGFRSMEQLTAWFGAYAEQLHEAGLRVAVYEVDDDRGRVVHGQKQLCFVRDEAQLLERKSLLEVA